MEQFLRSINFALPMDKPSTKPKVGAEEKKVGAKEKKYTLKKTAPRQRMPRKPKLQRAAEDANNIRLEMNAADQPRPGKSSACAKRESELIDLRNRTLTKLSHLQAKYTQRLTAEARASFAAEELDDMPLLSLTDALTREYKGAEIKVIRKKEQCKQKISLKVGDANMSIGEYDSAEDGDISTFVNKALKERGIRPRNKFV